MTYAEAVNSLESYLLNIDSAISFENWMEDVSKQLFLIYGKGSFQERNFQSLKNDFETSKTGLTDPVKYRINEKNFRLRAKSHLGSLVSGLQEAEKLAIYQAEQKKKEAEEQRLKEQRAAEVKRLQEELESRKREEQLNATVQHKEHVPLKRSRGSKAIPWIMAPVLAALLFYAGYALGSVKEEKEKVRLANENKTLKKNVSSLTDSLYQQKLPAHQPVDSSIAK